VDIEASVTPYCIAIFDVVHIFPDHSGKSDAKKLAALQKELALRNV
jgi:hypothetical protein